MTDMTMNNNGNRKKYLVPLVVLLLCGVALTGAAYAYTSTITASDDIETQYYELQFQQGESKSQINLLLPTDKYLAFNTTTTTVENAETHAKEAKTVYSLNAADSTGVTATVALKTDDNDTKHTSGFTVDLAKTKAVLKSGEDTISDITVTVTDADATTSSPSHTLNFAFSTVEGKTFESIETSYTIELILVTVGTSGNVPESI